MAVFDDATQRIDYGPALPPVCDPNVGRCFFLTTDTVDGRGLYICTAINTWTHIAPGGIGPVLPPGGTDGDVFFVNAGVNIGIYQYFNTVWNKTGSRPSTITPGPVSYTDFTDTNLWLPIGSVDVTQAIAAAGMTLTGVTARAALSGLSGVISLFRVYPDALNSNLEISCTFDNYARATDLLANDEFRFGCLWIAESTRSGNDDFTGIGYGGLDGGNQDFFALEQYSDSLGGAGWVGLSVFGTAIPALTTFTLLAQSLRMVWSGNQDHGFRNVTCTMDGGGGPLGGLIVQAGSATNVPCALVGLRMFLGCWFNTTSNTIAARLTNFTVTQGRVVAF